MTIQDNDKKMYAQYIETIKHTNIINNFPFDEIAASIGSVISATDNTASYMIGGSGFFVLYENKKYL